MAAFNTSTRHDDMSLRLRAQNMRKAKEQTKRLELESRKMEERLKELKMAMSREKEEREKNGGGFWRSGQSGNLSSYATSVLDQPSKTSVKESKRRAVKILKDEPLDLPSRSSEPGTMKYIAKTSQKTEKESRMKGPKCGQCEDRAACLTCVQCSEHYCSGCFAAFHLRGALKKHRSVPLHASGPRQCMSPWPTPPTSYRETVKPSPAAGAVSSSIDYQGQESECNRPEGASGSFESPSLLHGQYNEADSAASFQAALQAWRNGDCPSLTPSPCKSVPPCKSTAAVSVDTCTTMTDKTVSPEIKFSHTISYADRLLLKQHRRTDPGGLESPRSYDDYPSPHSAGMGDSLSVQDTRREGTLDLSDENPVSFSALYQASVSNINQAVCDVSRPESSLSIVELQESPPKSRHVDHTDKYKVQEAGSFEAWELQNYRKSLSSRSASETDHIVKTPLSKTHSHKSCSRITVENAVTETQVPQDHHGPITYSLPDSRGDSQEKLEDRLKSDTRDGGVSVKDQGTKRPKSRPASRKSQDSARPKSGRQSRPNSRALRHAASVLSDSVLTKTPSTALHDIASRLKETDTQLYSPTLQDFFMAGVKPAPQERTTTPSRDKKQVIKVSNRLYQMAPRSWRPDSSLGDVLPMDEALMADTDTVISFTYSGQILGQPGSVTRATSSGGEYSSRSGAQQRCVFSPTPSQSRKSTSQWSSCPSEPGSDRHATSTEQYEQSGRTSQAIVLDGDDMTQYDDVEMGHHCNKEDEETLNQLEWELASESGRITGDGQLSRLHMLDSVSDSGGSSGSSTPVIKLSMDKGFDINMKLRHDELCEEVDENANQKKDEEDVKDLQ